MNTPHPLVALLGNAVGAVIATLFTGFLVYCWAVNPGAPWFLPYLAAFMFYQVAQARWKYKQHKAWQQSADDLAGLSEQRKVNAATRRRWLFTCSCIALWIGSIWWIQEHRVDRVGNEMATLIWLAISLLWLGLTIRGFIRWRGRRRQAVLARRERDHVVTVATVKHRSPTPESAAAELPDYVKDLLNQPKA